MSNKTLLKIWGILKIIIGGLLIIIGFGTLSILIKDDNTQFYYWATIVFGLICFEYYGFYNIYSGLHDIKSKPIKRKIYTWIAFAISILFTLTYFEFFSDAPFNPDYAVILLISFFFLPALVDMLRISIKKRNENLSI